MYQIDSLLYDIRQLDKEMCLSRSYKIKTNR